MKKRIALVVVAVFAGLAILTVGAGLLLGPLLTLEGGPEFEAPGVLTMDLDGPLVERAPGDFLAAGLVRDELELFDVVTALDRAATDDRIAGVVVRIGTPGYGWAKAEEIRSRLDRFRESGKFVYAFSSGTNELGYYVALAADRFDLLPDALVEMNGFRVETPFVKGTLEKLGLDPQVEAIGAYKSAADILRRDNMSPEEREVTEAILEQRYGRFVDAVIEARGVERERFVDAFDQGVYLARDLQALGLIDAERHMTDVLREAVARALEREADEVAVEEIDARTARLEAYAEDLPEAPGEIRGTVGLVYATGAIVQGESGYDPLFGHTMGSETVVRMLHDVAGDDALDAVVIRIDSPGGDAYASEMIWGAIAELSERLPVVVSMSDVAASGGYYIAAAADSIVAAPSTITGSIGVVAVLFDASGLFDKLGISWDTVQTNPAADFPTAIRPLTEEERATFHRLVRDTYMAFVRRVSQGREMPVPEVEEVAQGRVWTGAQAMDRGLVDRLGGLDEGFDVAKRMAGIDPGARVRLHVYPRAPSVLEQIRRMLRMRGRAPARDGPLLGSPQVDRRVRELLRLVPGAALLVREPPGRPLAVLPWIPEAR
ncbi:MAG: signal peptide peptidase SppA [Gemmatimonadota bacterium]|nr:signal peptide peptidase SppA [Gemmatimonadota bacterium]